MCSGGGTRGGRVQFCDAFSEALCVGHLEPKSMGRRERYLWECAHQSITIHLGTGLGSMALDFT